MNNCIRMAMILSLALAAACSTTAEENAILARARTLQTSPEYEIGEGDNLTIQILGPNNPSIQGQTVRPDGKISFPGYGDIDVKGKTPEQLRKELEKKFQNPPLAIRNPTVYVSVNSFGSKNVTVLGQVQTPGRFPYTGQMRVTDLLGAVHGYLPTADPNRTLLFREIGDQTKVYHVRLKRFLVDADFTTNFYVRPGDILYVPLNGFSLVAQKIEIIVSPLRALLSFVNVGQTTTRVFVP